MTSFSQRHGYKPIKSILQIRSMDDELRTSLWNALHRFYWSKADPEHSLKYKDNRTAVLRLKALWTEYFTLQLDTLPNSWDRAQSQLNYYLFNCRWNEVCDFIEFVADYFPDDEVNASFRIECNRILARECSGYRFIEDQIAPITSAEEIAEIEEALSHTQGLSAVTTHLQSALSLFSDRESPDYRNSIKEAISAVEAISKLVAGKDKAKLGEALKKISDKIEMHPALTKAFGILYGYTSEANGIRHALLEEDKLDSEDAKFMLVACSAFVNYLKVKATKAGIGL